MNDDIIWNNKYLITILFLGSVLAYTCSADLLQWIGIGCILGPVGVALDLGSRLWDR